jgi:hypothetical protein
MKVIASSIAVLAATVLVHPVLSNWVEQHENESVAAQCWSPDSFESATTLVTAMVLDNMEESLRREAPNSKVTRDDIAKNLKVRLGVPSVSGANMEIKSAQCSVQVDIDFKGAKSSGALEYSVLRSNSGLSTLVRNTDMAPILVKFNLAIMRLASS